jgi:hypothetical protein
MQISSFEIIDIGSPQGRWSFRMTADVIENVCFGQASYKILAWF